MNITKKHKLYFRTNKEVIEGFEKQTHELKKKENPELFNEPKSVDLENNKQEQTI